MFPSPLNHCRSRQQRSLEFRGEICLWPYRVIFNEGGELRIRHDTVEGAVDVERNLAVDFEVWYFPFYAAWSHEPRKLRAVREV